MATSNEHLEPVINPFIHRVENHISSLNSTRQEEQSNDEAFDFDEFWKNIVTITTVISHDATALCTAFESPTPPDVEDCKPFIARMDSTIKKFILIFRSLPILKGKTLRENVLRFVVSVLEAVKSIGTDICVPSPLHLKNAGNLWEKCESVNQLPKDNKEAVLAIFRDEMSLVGDAIDELSGAIENGLANDSLFLSFMRNGFRLDCPNNWTESELRVVHPCLGLIKAVKACLKRTYMAISNRGNAIEPGPIQELDEMARLVKLRSSSIVDDLIEVLYPPATYDDVRSNALILKVKSTDLLMKAQSSHFCSESDKSWIEFLQKAVDHNFTQINDRVPPLL